MIFRFPANFFWGTATSAHQVEGGNYNDFAVWEKKYAEVLANKAKEIWTKKQLQRFPQMLDPANYVSNKAANQYKLYEQDFDLAKRLNTNAHRFSLEWSRIEPQKGKFDKNVIEHYRKVIRALRKRNIEPFVSLWHWTSPVWLYDQNENGGWENKETVDYFLEYVSRVVHEFKNDVRYWIVVNEPEVYTAGLYTLFTSPKRGKLFSCLKVFNNLLTAHKKARKLIKSIDSNCNIGMSKSYWYFKTQNNSPVNLILKKITDWLWNFYIYNRTNGRHDFIGLNIYDYVVINNGWTRGKTEICNDLGYPVLPEIIYHAVKDMGRFKIPIIITEHGIVDAGDKHRTWYIKESLKWLVKALKEGADVRGYMHWSLIDNFEWDKGFWPRLGLIEVDYKTQKRSIKQSAKYYAKICKENAIET